MLVEIGLKYGSRKHSGTAKVTPTLPPISNILDLVVQGPSLVHYDSPRAFPPRSLLPVRLENPDCYKMHSFNVSKNPEVKTCEQVYQYTYHATISYILLYLVKMKPYIV